VRREVGQGARGQGLAMKSVPAEESGRAAGGRVLGRRRAIGIGLQG